MGVVGASLTPAFESAWFQKLNQMKKKTCFQLEPWISELCAPYTSVNSQKRAFNSGARHTIDKLLSWAIQRWGAGRGVRVCRRGSRKKSWAPCLKRKQSAGSFSTDLVLEDENSSFKLSCFQRRSFVSCVCRLERHAPIGNTYRQRIYMCVLL